MSTPRIWTVFRINPFASPEVVERIAAVYQEAFGGEPWYEGYKCPVCEGIFPRIPTVRLCTVCAEQSRKVLLVDYWPAQKVISDFYREMRHPHAVCFVAEVGKTLTDRHIVGFVWGYRISSDDPDFETHLEAPDFRYRDTRYFYVDDCAVLPAYHGKGLGTLLMRNILSAHPYYRVLLRTKEGGRMFNLFAGMGGRVIQSISDGRVIMEMTIEGNKPASLPLRDPGWSMDPLGFESGH